MRKAVKFTLSISSQTLVDDFKRECKRRGRKQSWVIENAMRYYVDHPQAGGWSNGAEVIPKTKLFSIDGKVVKPLSALTKSKRKKKSPSTG